MRRVAVVLGMSMTAVWLAGCMEQPKPPPPPPKDFVGGQYTLEITQSFPVEVRREGDEVVMVLPFGRKDEQEYRGSIQNRALALTNEYTSPADEMIYHGVVSGDGLLEGRIEYRATNAPSGRWRLVDAEELVVTGDQSSAISHR